VTRAGGDFGGSMDSRGGGRDGRGGGVAMTKLHAHFATSMTLLLLMLLLSRSANTNNPSAMRT